MIGTGASGVQVVPELAKIAAARDGLSAHPAVDGAQGRPPLQRNGIGAIPAQPAGGPPRHAGGSGSCSTTTPRPAPTTRWSTARSADRRRRSWSAPCADERLRARADTGLSVPLQAGAAGRRLLPGAAAGPRRAGHRSHRPDHRDVGRAPRPARPSTSTRSCWPPDSRPSTTCRASRSSASAGSACTSGGVTTRAPTWASRSAASRTSSCSTAPTPTRAATRSSTSSRPARDWWPARSAGWRAAAATSRCAPRPKSVTTNELSADLERTIWTQCDSYFRSPTGRIVTQWPYTELEYARAHLAAAPAGLDSSTTACSPMPKSMTPRINSPAARSA